MSDRRASLASTLADAQVEYIRNYMIEKTRKQYPASAGANLGIVEMFKTMTAPELWKRYFAEFTQHLCASLGVVPDNDVRSGLVYDYCLNRFGKTFEAILDDDSIDISDDIVFHVTAMVQEATSEFMEQVDDLTEPAELLQPLGVDVRPIIVLKRVAVADRSDTYHAPMLFIEVSHTHVLGARMATVQLYFPVSGL